MTSGPEPAALEPAAVMLDHLWVGSRVVVRYRIEGGFTDALGDLVDLTTDRALIRTRRGEVPVPLGHIVAAKQVPPPPVRRPR